MKLIRLILLCIIFQINLLNTYGKDLESEEKYSNPNEWLTSCVINWSIVHKMHEGLYYFRGGGANDPIFVPEQEAESEIFQNCMEVEPLPDNQISRHIQWIGKCISDIESIVPGKTRKFVNNLLVKDGGTSSRTRATYYHRDCTFLKVRVHYEKITYEDINDIFEYSDKDKVEAISPSYLGLHVYD